MKGLRIVAEGEVEDIGFGDGNAGRRDDLAGIVIFVVSLALRHGGSLSQTLFGKEIADVVDEGLRLFHRHEMAARSEGRRVGQECVSTCRSRWSQYHSKTKTH